MTANTNQLMIKYAIKAHNQGHVTPLNFGSLYKGDARYMYLKIWYAN